MSIHKLIYIIGEKLRNPKMKMHREALMQSDFMKIDELKKLQLERFKRLLEHAKKHSSYYQKVLQDIEIETFTMDQLTQIPILEKQTLRDELKHIENNPYNEKVFASSTSGSTGESMKFIRNLDWDGASRAVQVRGFSWYGVAPWMKNLYFWGFNASWKKLIVIRFFDFLVNRKRVFSYDDTTMQAAEGFLKKADYIEGYSSAIFTMSQYFSKKKKKFKHIKMVKGTSEKIYDAYQKPVQDVFGTPLISEYGSAEAGIIAFECPEGKMHIAMENVIVEEIDNKILVTNLFSFSLPIIRYDLGDYIELSKDKPCACGREHEVIKEVTGRVGTNIQGYESSYPALYLYYVFKNISLGYGINVGYQSCQDTKGHLNLKVVYEGDEVEQVRGYIKDEVYKLFKNDIDCNIEFTANIAHANKKTQAFISFIGKEETC